MQWSELKEGQVVRLMASRHRLSLTGYPLKEAMVCFFGCFFSVLYRIFCTCKVIKPVYICHIKDAQSIPQKSTLQHLSGIEIWDLTRSFQFFNPFFGEWAGVLNKIYILGTYCSYRDNALLVFQMCLLFYSTDGDWQCRCGWCLHRGNAVCICKGDREDAEGELWK